MRNFWLNARIVPLEKAYYINMFFNYNYPQSSKAILGVRIWRCIKNENGEWILKPAHAGVEATNWEKTNKAHCFDAQKRHAFYQIPHEKCRCGFHAYYSPERALAEYHMCTMKFGFGRKLLRLSRSPGERFVIGIIAGANQTRKHNLGFRSSEAQIISIAPIKKEDSQIVKDISEKLDVDFQDGVSELNSLYERLKKDSRFKYIEKTERPSSRGFEIIRRFFLFAMLALIVSGGSVFIVAAAVVGFLGLFVSVNFWVWTLAITLAPALFVILNYIYYLGGSYILGKIHWIKLKVIAVFNKAKIAG